MYKLITSPRNYKDLSVGFARETESDEEERASDIKRFFGEFHLRILFKDVFCFAEYHEKSIFGFVFEVTMIKNKTIVAPNTNNFVEIEKKVINSESGMFHILFHL